MRTLFLSTCLSVSTCRSLHCLSTRQPAVGLSTCLPLHMSLYPLSVPLCISLFTTVCLWCLSLVSVSQPVSSSTVSLPVCSFYCVCVSNIYLNLSVNLSVRPSVWMPLTLSISLPVSLSASEGVCVSVRQLSMEAGYKEKLAGGW